MYVKNLTCLWSPNPSVSVETHTTAGRDVPVNSRSSEDLWRIQEDSHHPQGLFLHLFTTLLLFSDPEGDKWHFRAQRGEKDLWRILKAFLFPSLRCSPEHGFNYLHEVHRWVPALRGAGKVSFFNIFNQISSQSGALLPRGFTFCDQICSSPWARPPPTCPHLARACVCRRGHETSHSKIFIFTQIVLLMTCRSVWDQQTLAFLSCLSQLLRSVTLSALTPIAPVEEEFLQIKLNNSEDTLLMALQNMPNVIVSRNTPPRIKMFVMCCI